MRRYLKGQIQHLNDWIPTTDGYTKAYLEGKRAANKEILDRITPFRQILKSIKKKLWTFGSINT